MSDIAAAGTAVWIPESRHSDNHERELSACVAACDTLAGAAKQGADGAPLQAESLPPKGRGPARNDAASRRRSALTETQGRVKMLTDMQHEYEGFSRSVKAVMRQAEKGAMHGVHGPVSALITTEKRFVTAIDTGARCVGVLHRGGQHERGQAGALRTLSARMAAARPSCRWIPFGQTACGRPAWNGRTAASALRMPSSDLMKNIRILCAICWRARSFRRIWTPRWHWPRRTDIGFALSP